MSAFDRFAFAGLLGGLVVFTAVASLPSADPPRRLKRAESFLGIHFDLHAGEDCTEMGKNTTPAMIENILNIVHPDYLQIDCKGHPGVSSYPTKVGHPVPGFVGDPLRVWRDVTARHGVGLYMHYSGVWDTHAGKNPGWAAWNAEGQPNPRANSVFGPYADRLLIPQLKELAGVYGVDGVWVDGECWATAPDYGPKAQEAFRKATGFPEVPKKPGDPHWWEFLQFHRQAFRDYLNHYIREVKKEYPQFQICSNWAFTDHMPEPVCAPVDFLSGDYSPQDSVNSARLSARFLARQGLPWDLMAWSFTTAPPRTQKSVPQLQREAAVVLAMGGGFQAYFKQKRDGSIYPEQMPTMGEVAKFCRARQETCHRAEAVPQVALLYSTAAHYRKISGLFTRDVAPVRGIVQACVESQFSVELLAEHHLHGRMREYPLIIVPEWDYVEPAFQAELRDYARAGGKLLLIGPKSAALFAEEIGARFEDAPTPLVPLTLEYESQRASLKGSMRKVTLDAKARAFGQVRRDGVTNPTVIPAASFTPCGSGVLAACYCSLGQGYLAEPGGPIRPFLQALVRQLMPEPMVEVHGSTDVDLCLMRKDGKLLVNLINTSGPHRTQPIIPEIAPTAPLEVVARLPARPRSVVLKPSGRNVNFAYADGKMTAEVGPVAIHEIVVIEP